MKQIYSLSDAIKDGITLDAEQQAALLHLIGSGCRKETKERLARRLALPLPLWTNHGIFGRVYIRYNDERVHYCAGQDYTSEIRTVRQCVLGQ